MDWSIIKTLNSKRIFYSMTNELSESDWWMDTLDILNKLIGDIKLSYKMYESFTDIVSEILYNYSSYHIRFKNITDINELYMILRMKYRDRIISRKEAAFIINTIVPKDYRNYVFKSLESNNMSCHKYIIRLMKGNYKK